MYECWKKNAARSGPPRRMPGIRLRGRHSEKGGTAGAQKPVIVVALDSDIDHIEPMEFRSDAGYYATANLLEPLIAQKMAPRRGPAGATGRNARVRSGPRQRHDLQRRSHGYTLKIHKGAKFQDGSPITAAVLQAYFLDWVDHGQAQLHPAAGPVHGLQQGGCGRRGRRLHPAVPPGEGERPVPSAARLPGLRRDGPRNDEGACHGDRHQCAFDWYHKNANPSGPYTITKWDSAVEYDFEPNPNYWQGPELLQEQQDRGEGRPVTRRQGAPVEEG